MSAGREEFSHSPPRVPGCGIGQPLLAIFLCPKMCHKLTYLLEKSDAFLPEPERPGHFTGASAVADSEGGGLDSSISPNGSVPFCLPMCSFKAAHFSYASNFNQPYFAGGHQAKVHICPVSLSLISQIDPD